MTKGKWFLISGGLILLSVLIQLMKLIHNIDKDSINGLSFAVLGVGIGIFLITLLKKGQ